MTMTDQTNRSRLMLLMSMTIFGTLPLFVRNIAVSSQELALYRALMAALLIGGYLLATGRKPLFDCRGKDVPLLLFSGVALGLNWILLFEAYRHTTVSVATLSYYFAPVLVTLSCPLFFREKLTGRQILCFIMSTAGLVLIISPDDLAKGGTHAVGILFGLGAAVLYAAVVLLNKCIHNIQGIHRTFFQFLAAIFILAIHVAATRGVRLPVLALPDLFCLLVVGIVHTGIAYCLYFSALGKLPGQEVAILSYTDPLVAVFVSVALLNEHLTLPQIFGGVLILGFTLWNEIQTGGDGD